MAGHSKWKNIQVRKSAQDAKKGKVFTKVTKEIMLAARNGGDPAINARLRTAIAAAKAVNLPKDKIETALKKGTGEIAADSIEEVTYEGYGPGGVAILIAAATDNRNRTVAEVRHILSKGGGAMGENGSVAWMFNRCGLFTFAKTAVTEEKLMEIALEAGADDIIDAGDDWEVRCPPEAFSQVQEAFEQAGLKPEAEELTMIPQNTIAVDIETGRKLLKLLDNLDDNEDVQEAYANFELPDELLEE